MPAPNSGSAIVLANNHFRDRHGKTTHGMVRGPSRFPIRAVVDATCAGQDAGELLDGRHRAIPIVDSVRAALALPGEPPEVCAIGVATGGGVLPDDLRGDLLAAADAGLTLINGLHQLLESDRELADRVRAGGGSIIDIRKPRSIDQLRFYTGEVLSLATPRIAVLGTDCALGKRTTCTLLVDALEQRGLRAGMIHTGQTGWLQGLPYGFIFDSTINDFVSGELEGAILRCARETDPDLILLEGQSALRNPSGPCGAEFLVSAGAQGVILQHAPGRPCFEGFEAEGHLVPPLVEELELIRLYGSEVWAITLSEIALEPDQAARAARDLEQELGLPVCRPLGDGLLRLADLVVARVRRTDDA